MNQEEYERLIRELHKAISDINRDMAVIKSTMANYVSDAQCGQRWFEAEKTTTKETTRIDGRISRVYWLAGGLSILVTVVALVLNLTRLLTP